MLSGRWIEVVAVVAGYAVAVLAMPAGISGAVLLLPFQVRVLDVPPMVATPTNLLYNLIATPRCLVPVLAAEADRWPPDLVLLAGRVPGVIAGSVIRIELLHGMRVST